MECHACGKRFRSAIAEAKHRHNWPVMCKRFAARIKENEKVASGGCNLLLIC